MAVTRTPVRQASWLVDLPFRWANQKKLSEIIPFQTRPFIESPHFLKEKYIKEGWSATKIAKYCRCSTAYVLSCLKKFRIKIRPKGCNGGMIAFGKKITKDGKAIPYVKELKIVQKIVDLRNQGLTYGAIAERLKVEGVPTKQGGKWHHFTVSQIYLKFRDNG